MHYRRMGKTGLALSEFSFGSWVTFGNQVNQKAANNLMAAAYDAGINFFDNAEGYEAGESERLMGKAISDLGWSRDSFVVSSKVFWGGSKPNQKGLSRKHVFDACHAALQRLRVDYLDLYFCHRPDVDTPISETVAAMTDLVRQGKVMYWGTSEWNAQQITEAWAFAKAENMVAPVVEQPEYNLINRAKVEGEFAPLYTLTGMGLTIWSPLSSGLLTGKYLDGVPEGSRLSLPEYAWLRKSKMGDGNSDELNKIQQLAEVARDLDVPMHHLALNWCLANKNVSTVILGVSKMSQLEDNLRAKESADKLTPDVLLRLDDILDNKPVGPARF